MKVITFSKTFPTTHPRKGEPTFFVEKIWAGLADRTDRLQGNVDMDWHEYYNGVPKWHTIRAGNRWKVGDLFSPRYWTAKPYASKQALITEPLEIKKLWDIQISGSIIFMGGKPFSGDKFSNQVANLAKNDGLEVTDFWNWFKIKPGKVFEGQIICWADHINY